MSTIDSPTPSNPKSTPVRQEPLQPGQTTPSNPGTTTPERPDVRPSDSSGPRK